MFAEALVAVIDREPDLQVVATAATGGEAVRLAGAQAPDVVVMDYLLEDGDGLAATRDLRRSSPGTQVVLLSGVDGDDVRVAALRAGCHSFLSKLQAPAALVDTIRRAYRGEEHAAAGAPEGRSLTPRELEILRMVAGGRSNREIGQALGMSVHTVRCHVRNACVKLGCHSKLAAAAEAARQGIIPPV